jgi:nucleotide-binding universal stress UspA family protein
MRNLTLKPEQPAKPADRIVSAVRAYLEDEDSALACAPDPVPVEAIKRDLGRARRRLLDPEVGAYVLGRTAGAPFHHILVAIDGSEHSSWAAEAAGRMARDLGAKLTLLHVFGVPMILAGEIGYVQYPPTADTRQDGEDMLRRAAAKVPAGVRVEQLIHEGDAKRQIVAAAKDVGADLIMMGRHAKGPLARMMLGSVAEYVVRHAHCPVLTMGHPAEAEVLPEHGTSPLELTLTHG